MLLMTKKAGRISFGKVAYNGVQTYAGGLLFSAHLR